MCLFSQWLIVTAYLTVTDIISESCFCCFIVRWRTLGSNIVTSLWSAQALKVMIYDRGRSNSFVVFKVLTYLYVVV